MNDIGVWLPLACAVVGFAMGGLIGYGADKMRRRELIDGARFADASARALVDACREVLSDAWFNKVRRRYLTKMEGGLA